MKINKGKAINYIIVLLSILFFLIVVNLPFRAKSFGDLDFHQEARNIAGWIHGSVSGDVVKISKAPGPVLFYTAPYLLAGKNADDATLWKFGVGWNFLWLTIALLLLKDTATLLFSFREGWMVVCLTMLLPVHLYYGIGILAETLAFVGVAFFIYGTARIFERNTIDKAGIAAIVGGIVALCSARPNSLLLLGLIPMILLFFYFRKDKAGMTTAIRGYWSAWLVSVLAMFLLFILIRQLPGYSNKANQESYFIFVMHQGRFQFRTETWDWRFWDDEIRADSKDYQAWQQSSQLLHSSMAQTGKSIQTVYGKWVLEDILEHPSVVIKQFFVKILFGHFLQISSVSPDNFKLGPLQGKTGYYLIIGSINIFNLFILLCAIISFLKYFRTKRFLLLIIAPWLALIVFHGLVYMEQRYLFPARPIILLLASPIIVAILQNIKPRFTHDTRSLPGHSAI